MATPSFQLYMDKENMGSIGGLTKARNRIGTAPVAKIFGATGGKPGFATPARKALGDMNRDPLVGTPGFTPKHKGLSLGGEFKKPVLKVTGPTPIKRQPLSSRPVNLQQEQFNKKSLKSQAKPALSSRSQPRQKLIIPDDIETGFIYQDEEDDFEDIWPKKDRPSSYLDALINWRPSCFGDPEDEESEEEEAAQRRKDIDECIREIDQLVLNWKPHEDLVDNAFPVEDLLEPELNIDISLPSLDESLDIYQHIGTLQLKDD